MVPHLSHFTAKRIFDYDLLFPVRPSLEVVETDDYTEVTTLSRSVCLRTMYKQLTYFFF